MEKVEKTDFPKEQLGMRERERNREREIKESVFAKIDTKKHKFTHRKIT